MGCSYETDWINIIRNFISHIIYYSLIFFVAYGSKGQVLVFAGQVKIESHLSCRTSAILKYFCPLSLGIDQVKLETCKGTQCVVKVSKCLRAD